MNKREKYQDALENLAYIKLSLSSLANAFDRIYNEKLSEELFTKSEILDKVIHTIKEYVGELYISSYRQAQQYSKNALNASIKLGMEEKK